MRRRHLLLGFLGALAAPSLAVAAPAATPIVVFAAASLGTVLQHIGDAFEGATGTPVRFNFAASSTLARQIDNGAAADVYVSADEAWMDYLAERGHLRAGSRRDLVGNRLVLVAPADSAVRLALEPHVNLLAALGGGRLAVGDPDAVPAGRYARAALISLGVWADVEPRLARAADVRAALAFAARGEAPLAIVYETDARAEPRVRIVGTFPDGSHPPIAYPAALTAAAPAAAAAFLDYLTTPAALRAFERAGFRAPPAATAGR
ncbi:MAG: molybdate ABC transporter substrate-binding protein [Proteobacteria bacterium]|nr:molybdate ABC transporter substrate-binding protein [Pseudomonadota bacterium]